jgi:hypothetical protein
MNEAIEKAKDEIKEARKRICIDCGLKPGISCGNDPCRKVVKIDSALTTLEAEKPEYWHNLASACERTRTLPEAYELIEPEKPADYTDIIKEICDYVDSYVYQYLSVPGKSYHDIKTMISDYVKYKIESYHERHVMRPVVLS